MTPDQDAFLRDHVWGLLATSRAEGSPQVTMVAYQFDGSDAVVSCVRGSAKFANACAHPDVVLTVPDGRRYLSVYGTADCLATGAERDELTHRVRDGLEPADAAILDDAFARGLDRAGRVIIRVRPTNVLGRI
jgi:PPOX class probable F420-dependent enzyme